MKRMLLCLLFALLCAARSEATWTLVQFVAASCSASTSCTVTVASTGAGHVIKVGLATNVNITITSVTGEGTATLCGVNCQKGNATAGWVDMAYILSSTGGSTSITMNHAGGSNASVGMVWEYSLTSPPAVFDDGQSVLDTVNCGSAPSCAGTGLTLSGSSDAISTIASCGGTCSAISGPYVNDSNLSGDQGGHLLNTNSGTAPTITQAPNSNLVSAAIAIKETSAGGGGAPGLDKGRKLEVIDPEIAKSLIANRRAKASL